MALNLENILTMKPENGEYKCVISIAAMEDKS